MTLEEIQSRIESLQRKDKLTEIDHQELANLDLQLKRHSNPRNYTTHQLFAMAINNISIDPRIQQLKEKKLWSEIREKTIEFVLNLDTSSMEP